MTQGVEVITPDAAIKDVAQKMQQLDIGSLPICDGEQLAGMLTERDLTARIVMVGRDPATTKVREAITPKIFTALRSKM
jgi:CBS domain-containing protein